jgi:hypothetical protein
LLREAENLMPAGERVRKLEGAILDELRVKAAVGSEVDVFEEDAEERGRDGRAGVGGVDGDDNGSLLGLGQKPERGERERDGGEDEFFKHRLASHAKGFLRARLLGLLSNAR